MTGPPRAHGSAPGHRGGDPLRDDPHTHPPGRSLRSTSTRSLPHHSQSTCYSATPRCAKTSRHSLIPCNNWHRASTPNGSKGSSPSWARRRAGVVEVAPSQGWITLRVRFLSERRRRWSRWPSQATGRESVSPPHGDTVGRPYGSRIALSVVSWYVDLGGALCPAAAPGGLPSAAHDVVAALRVEVVTSTSRRRISCLGATAVGARRIRVVRRVVGGLLSSVMPRRRPRWLAVGRSRRRRRRAPGTTFVRRPG